MCGQQKFKSGIGGNKMRKMNKKAIFFTLLVIVMLSLFLISYIFYSVVKSREALNKRIETMNNFVFADWQKKYKESAPFQRELRF